jgi:hypothetical protein
MNWALRKGLGVLLFIVGLGEASHAALIESYAVRDWDIGAYSDDQTKEFSHCAMSASYKNGILLIFSIDRSKNWFMGLANDNWRLTEGERYDFDIQLDGAQGKRWFGDAVNPKMLLVPLADSAALFELFSAANILTVNAANGTYRFSLSNSRIALQAVAECTARHLAASVQNPFAKGNPFERAPRSPGSGRDDGAYYSEGAVVMTNVLSSIGATGYRLAALEELRKDFKGYHAVWIGKGAAGSLKILPDAASIPDIGADLLAASATSCDGKLASGKTSAGKALKIVAVCDANSGKILNYQYIVAPRPQGGSFLFSIVALEDDAASVNSASKVGDLMLASLQK